MNITPEKDCRRFLCKETFVRIATIANAVGSQQWKWWGKATAVETHNNQPTNGSDMAAETAFTAAAAATAAAVAAAVATAAMAFTAAVQTATVATAAREIYIKKGRKRR